MLFAYLWIALAMPLAWLAKYLDDKKVKYVPHFIIFFVGYGALILAAACSAWWREMRGADHTWDKTLKSGSVGVGG